MIDRGIHHCENNIVVGDINYDMTAVDKSQTLFDLCKLCNMNNLISEPFCYKSNCYPSLVEVFVYFYK